MTLIPHKSESPRHQGLDDVRINRQYELKGGGVNKFPRIIFRSIINVINNNFILSDFQLVKFVKFKYASSLLYMLLRLPKAFPAARNKSHNAWSFVDERWTCPLLYDTHWACAIRFKLSFAESNDIFDIGSFLPQFLV